MKDYIKLIRPEQWAKNIFVFAPIVFGGELLNGKAMISGLITFLAFSFAASSIYCFNDIIDVEDDRRHPEKRVRPIASGAVTKRQANHLMAVLTTLSLACIGLLAFFNGAQCFSEGLFQSSAGGVFLVISFYLLLNYAYCVKLKQFSIIDVCIVASGFVLRLWAGGLATGIVLSKWIVLMTFLIALFMSFAKRRDDVIHWEATGEALRRNTTRYNTVFIDQALAITAVVTLVCYIMYTVSPEVIARFNNDRLYLTSVFVLVGLLRYLQLTMVENKSGNPTTIILKDRFIQLVVLAWLAAFLFIIYIN